MPRMKQISAAQEREELFASVKSASVLYCKSRFLVHERVETQAMRDFVPSPDGKGSAEAEYEALALAEGVTPCPCCGSLCARLVETVDDLEVLINVDTKQRWNRWDNNTEDDFDRFDELAAQAEPYGTEMAVVWHVPIDFTVSREAMAQIQDDRTRVILWSGGWRSGKSHTAAEWFLRGWLLYGSFGELFWIAAPELKLAFRLMQRLFIGSGETDAQGWQRGRSVAPKFFDPDLKTWRSCVATSMPANEKAALMQFTMVDGSVVELRHTNGVNALEGTTVRRVLYDEAIRANGPEGYEILLGRVGQGRGQLGIATIPGVDGRGWWLWERVVAPAESGRTTGKRVFRVSSYENIWRPISEIVEDERSKDGDVDLIQRVIYGVWEKAGGMAYGGVWDSKTMAPMGIRDAHKPESWGFKYDLTKQVAISIWGPAAKDVEYLGGRDFNGPRNGGFHAGIVGKIFGNDLRDTKTWALVLLDEHVAKGDARAAARDFTERFRSGAYKGVTGVIGDRCGFIKGHVYSGKASESTDAYEFTTRGVLMEPPARTEKKRGQNGTITGGEPWYAGVPESKKLVRGMMEDGRILVDGQVCLHMVTALGQVKAGEKAKRDDGSSYDKLVACWDDCLRYLAWRVFRDEVPGPKKPKVIYRTNLPRL